MGLYAAGVDSVFFGVADFFGAAFLVDDPLVAAFLVAGADLVVFATRPDLVFVSTLGVSTTAGAW